MGLAWSQTLKNLVFPIFCRECRCRLLTDENAFYCPTCWEKSPRIARPFCTACGRPHPGALGLGTQVNFLCAECRETPNPQIGQIFGAAVYAGAVEETIKLMKFHDRPWAARALGDLLADFMVAEVDVARYDLLVPVPLHKVRFRERGFNQSELLAREVLPILPNARIDLRLQRIRPTRTQSRLQGVDRRENVRGAFAVVGDALAGEHVLLVDDVVTSATTVTECASALLRAGAALVDVLAAALTVSHRDRAALHE